MVIAVARDAERPAAVRPARPAAERRDEDRAGSLP